MTSFRHSALAALLAASSLSMAGATFSDEYSRFKIGTPAASEIEVPEVEAPEAEGPQLSPWLAGVEAEAPENKAPQGEAEVEVPGINTRVSAFSVPSHLVPPIGQGYLLSKSNAFSSRAGSISEITASESLKLFVWSKSMETTADMKKNAYKVKFASGETYQGELENLQNGYFAISLDFDGESGPLGEATLSIELEDQGKNKLKVDSVVFTRTEAASHDGVLVENKAEDEAEVVLVTTNTTETSAESPCVPCSNEPSGAMAFNNRTCEEWRLTKTKCAVPSYSWRRDQVCKLSCFMYGHAYNEDKCCTD